MGEIGVLYAKVAGEWVPILQAGGSGGAVSGPGRGYGELTYGELTFGTPGEAGSDLPAGGDIGNMLVKESAADYDVGWRQPALGITRNDLNAAATADLLVPNNFYLITNELPNKLAVALTTGSYVTLDTVSTYFPSAPPSALLTVAEENALPGYAASDWDISGAGNLSIFGYTTAMSARAGSGVAFKIHTNGQPYSLEIIRLGWYGGAGARLVDVVVNTTGAAQIDGILQSTGEGGVGARDCAFWSVTDVWQIPPTTTQGVYVAVIKPSGGGSSSWAHVGPFIITNARSDTADILCKFSDMTWRAYNAFGTLTDSNSGKTVYGVGGGQFSQGARAWAMTYDTPLMVAQSVSQTSYWNGERPIHAWLERNGYDVAYTSCLDVDTTPSILLGHRVLMSCGHDEYWSTRVRDAWDEAIAAGAHAIYASGNTMLWRVRMVGRVMFCYKDSHSMDGVGTGVDPVTWTGTWRDLRWEARRPENQTIGALFVSNGIRADTIAVPFAYKTEPLWRNTPIAALSSGEELTLKSQCLGFEWDSYEPSYANTLQYPAGLKLLSLTSVNLTGNASNENGSQYNTTINPALHHIVAFRKGTSLSVNFGTNQWGWGLSDFHVRGGPGTDSAMQQATLNLLADMGCQPATKQTELTPATNASASWVWPTLLSLTIPATASVPATGTVQLTAAAVWSNGLNTDLADQATWTSSDETVATVQKGLVVGVIEGTVTITATYGVRTDTCDVEVTEVAAGLDTFLPLTYTYNGTIYTDSPPAITLGVQFRRVSPQPIAVVGVRFWRSTVNQVAAPVVYVAKAGTTTPLKTANAAIGTQPAGWEMVMFSTPLIIEDSDPHVVWVWLGSGGYGALPGYFSFPARLSQIGLFDSTSQLGAGKFTQPPSGSPQTTPPTGVFNNNHYLVEPLISGDTTVVDAEVTALDVTPATLGVAMTNSALLVATATWTVGPPSVVTIGSTWVSSAPAVASVTSSGVVTGVSEGSATITATYQGFSDTCVVTVGPAPPDAVIIQNFHLDPSATVDHIVTFSPATAGDMLVMICAGQVLHAVTGWTKMGLGLSDSTETVAFYKTATAGESTVTITHNGSGIPMGAAVIRLPGGGTFVTSNQLVGQVSGADGPVLSGLSGSDLWVFGVHCSFRSPGSTPGDRNASWVTFPVVPVVEALDVDYRITNGYALTWCYNADYVAGTTWVGNPRWTGSGTVESIAFAIRRN